MKKALVILLALTLVFGLVLTACDIGGGGGGGGKKPAPTPPGGGDVWTVVFNMQDASKGTAHSIQALPAGAIMFPESGDTPITPLVRAGGNDAITIEAVSQGGKIALQYTTIASWGAGIDLNNDAFGFQVGDKITITGELIEGAKAQPNFSVGSENAYGFSVEAAGEFEWEIELTAAMLTAIRGGSPSAIRLEGRPAGVKVRIDNIVIEGNRPSSIVALDAPVVTATETGVSWLAVEGAGGYKVFAAGITDPLLTLGSAATSANINGITSLATGDYTITVVALGVTGVSADSDPSNAVVFTKTGVSTIYQVPAGGEDFFYVNLNDYQTQTPESANINSTVPAGVLAANKLTLSFTENNQRANFKLSERQAEILSTADSITVTIVGTTTPATSFRYHIGNALTGSNWNATNGSGDGTLSSILTSNQTFTGNRDPEDLATVGYFILQQRAAAETTVEITSIKIEFVGVVPPMVYELGEFTVSNNTNQSGWGFAGLDGDHDWDALLAAKYLVVESKGSGNNDGFGGFQVVIQTDGDSYGWNETDLISGWLSFAHTATDTVCLAIQLDTLTGYAAMVSGTKAKIFIAMYPLTDLGYQNAYLVEDMDKPSNAVDFANDRGFVYKE